jgi:predicted MPP superfamily phosphohydrolase
MFILHGLDWRHYQPLASTGSANDGVQCGFASLSRMPNTRTKSERPIRNATERTLNAMLLGGRVARLSYRLGGLGRVRVTHHAVALDPSLASFAAAALPRPLRIGFASDFHAGPTTAPALFDDLRAAIERERPDVLLLGGDYVSFDAAWIGALRSFLEAARAPLGTYAVIGNHDIWNGRAPVEAALRAAGIEVLVNRSVALPAPFGAVHICGIDDPWTGKPSTAATFAGADAAALRIFLTHSPDGVTLLDGQRYAAAFAGHTHGGQIAAPDGRPLFRPSGPGSRHYSYGRYEIPGNGPLFVSCGVGCSGIPLRINADPELVICTLGAEVA